MVKSVNVKKLDEFMASSNIADDLDQEKLDEIGNKVCRDYEIDLDSRSELDTINKKAMKLAKQAYEKKSFPWPSAANIKYPLITVAAIQFASRCFPEVVPDEKIVNFKITGADPEQQKEARADRVSKYMDYQLTEDIDGWLDGQDKLLHALPITGDCFKKVYYDPLTEKVAVDLLLYDDFVVNSKAKDLKSARRKTHKIYRYTNYITEMVNAGFWIEQDLGNVNTDDNDDDAPRLLLEQHRWLDLDDDGYEEPYIVTADKDSGKVFRIVAGYDTKCIKLFNGKLIRIEQIQYFVKYPFIPSLEGGFYDIGFGTLLYPMNESINTVINQLLDGGTLAITGGGFLARGVKLNAGVVKFKPGEWKTTDTMGQDLRSGVLPLPVKEPSQVLFQLLGLLISAGKDISSVQEAMSGQKPGENVSAATVTALIEQGLKVFSGIYKRIYRSISEELRLIWQLNGKYAKEETYIAILDEKVTLEDFNSQDYDIQPSADPMFSMDIQRVGRAEAMLKISGRPGLNEEMITSDYLKAIKVPQDRMIPPDQKQEPPPDPDQVKLGMEQERLDLEKREAGLKRMKLFAEIENLRAQAVNYIAKAEAEEMGQQLDEYKLFVDELGTYLEKERDSDNTRGATGMEGTPPDKRGVQANRSAQGAVE